MNAGPLAHKRAFAYLCQLVLQDPPFRRRRDALVARFGWLRELNLELAGETFQLLLDALQREDIALANGLCRQVYKTGLLEVAEFMKETATVGEAFAYDRIPNGGHFLIQMIVTGAMPNLLQFGDDRAVWWKPPLVIDPEDTFESFTDRVLAAARYMWEQAESERGKVAPLKMQRISLGNLQKRVEWFFKQQVKGESAAKMAAREGLTEYTVRTGINAVEKLLEIPVRRGRPRKWGSKFPQ